MGWTLVGTKCFLQALKDHKRTANDGMKTTLCNGKSESALYFGKSL